MAKMDKNIICAHCDEPILEHEDRANTIHIYCHRECALRAVVGGIGHLLDHAHFCNSELGPDAGLDYRTSALMVDVWIHRNSVEKAVEMGHHNV